jgi:hypothetical protein
LESVSARCSDRGVYTRINDSASRETVNDVLSVRSRPAGSSKRPSIAGGIDAFEQFTTSSSPHRASSLAPHSKGISMDTVKDICVIVPTVLLTAATVIGVATVISLGSWALL